MGKINKCLKYVFLFFNAMFVKLGFFLVGAIGKINSYNKELIEAGDPGISFGWMCCFGLFSFGILGISSLGIYAAFYEKPLALKIFAGFMVFGMVVTPVFGIIVNDTRNKIKNDYDSASSDSVKPYLEDEYIKLLLNIIQHVFYCCGVKGAEDWGNTIPESCNCMSRVNEGSSSSTCKNKPKGASGPARIYSQSCGDTMFVYVELFFKILMGFFFGFAVIALLGLLLSIVMIDQVKRHNSDGAFSIAMQSY